MKRFFICGTDTGIGKTMVSLLLMRALFQRGLSPHYYKWLQTGCRTPRDADSDARFVYAHTPELVRRDPGLSVGWCFENPKSPYHAARNAGMTLHRPDLIRALQRVCETHETIVAEASGGLMVPVSKNVMILDLIADAASFGFRPVLIARAGLGTINHTLLSVDALKNRGIPPLAILMVQEPGPLDPLLIQENQEAVREAAGIPVTGVIPRIQDIHAPAARAFEPCLRLIDAMP